MIEGLSQIPNGDRKNRLPAHKIHCSVLAEEAIKLALKDYYDKNGIEYDHSEFPCCDTE